MPLKIGLVGAGERGQIRARMLAGSPDFALVGVADSDRDRAADLAAEVRSAVFVSTPALLAASDVVCVATPTRDHYLIAREAIRQGKPVFLEWPPATSIPEAQALVRLAEEADVAVGVSCPILFHDGLLQARSEGPDTIIHLVFHFPEEGAEAINWPHELAETLALCTFLARTSVAVRLHAEATRAALPTLQAVAFTARMQNGVLIQALLHRAEGSASKMLFLAGPATSHTIDLMGPPSGCATAAETPTHLLDRELLVFLNAAHSSSRSERTPFTIREAMAVMHLLERLMGKLR